MTELAIYGGTFAPIHNGHIRAAREFLNAVCPDKLLIIPTRVPPHKSLGFADDPGDRLNMLRLAFGDEPDYGKRIFVSDFEITSPPPSYTVNTLRHFSEPGTRITLLLGTDMFMTIDKWYRSEEIMRLARLACMLRENADGELMKKVAEKEEFLKKNYGAEIIRINASPVEISSSLIRSGDDEFRKKYLPESVYRYIKERSLYENERH